MGGVGVARGAARRGAAHHSAVQAACILWVPPLPPPLPRHSAMG